MLHLILSFDKLDSFVEEYKPLNFSLCSLIHFTVTFSLLGANIFLSTLFSDTLSVCSSLNVRDQVSDLTKLYFCMFQYLYHWRENWKTKESKSNDIKHWLHSSCSKFSQELNFDLLRLFPNTWSFPPFQRICCLSLWHEIFCVMFTRRL